jgi:hypothetical protein
VINAVRSQASRSTSCWSYEGCGYLCQQSGSGNNWALGYHKYGASVQESVLDLVRKEVGQAVLGARPGHTRAARLRHLRLGPGAARVLRAGPGRMRSPRTAQRSRPVGFVARQGLPRPLRAGAQKARAWLPRRQEVRA